MLEPLVLIAVLALMVLGAWSSKRLSGWLRLTSTLVPPVVLAGAVVTYVVLLICNSGDSGAAEAGTACATTTAIGLPLTLAYLVITGGAWLGSVVSSGNRLRQRLLVKVSATTALTVPVVVVVSLLLYYGR